MSSPEFETLRSQVEKIEKVFNYVKNKVLEPSKLGRGDEAMHTVQSLLQDGQSLKDDIANRTEILQMNNSLCKKLDEETDRLIEQIERSHEQLQKQYGISFEGESLEEQTNPCSPTFDASPSVSGLGNQAAGPSLGQLSVNGRCRRLNFDDYGLRTPFACSTSRKTGKNTLTPGI